MNRNLIQFHRSQLHSSGSVSELVERIETSRLKPRWRMVHIRRIQLSPNEYRYIFTQRDRSRVILRIYDDDGQTTVDMRSGLPTDAGIMLLLACLGLLGFLFVDLETHIVLPLPLLVAVMGVITIFASSRYLSKRITHLLNLGDR